MCTPHDCCTHTELYDKNLVALNVHMLYNIDEKRNVSSICSRCPLPGELSHKRYDKSGYVSVELLAKHVVDAF